MILFFLLTASDVQSSKIAIVDSRKIFKTYKEAIEAQEKLDLEVMRWKVSLDSLKRLYEESKREYETQEAMLTDEAKVLKQKELSSLKKGYENFAKDIWGDNGKYEKKRQELFKPIIEKINKVIKEVANEENIAIVLDIAEAGVVYTAPGIDITQIVIDDLNEAFNPIVISGMKKKLVFLGVVPRGSQARNENAETEVKSSLVTILQRMKEDLNIELIEGVDVENMLESKGYAKDVELDNSNANEVASLLDGDFSLRAVVEKNGDDMTIILTLTEPLKLKSYPEQKVIVKRGENLSEKLASVMGAFKAIIKGE